MTTFRKTSAVQGEVAYANPNDINHTMVVRVNRSPKSAGVITLTNVRAEMIEGAKPSVTNGTDNARETSSIRIVASASTNNEAYLRAAVERAFANYLAWLDDGGLKGFVPSDTVSFQAAGE